jgi:carbonic anhydrase
MMIELNEILDRNRRWAESVEREDPDFFDNLARGQSPEIFWLGCSDSRVPPARIMDMKPGDVFVHRNIANLVLGSDVNFLSTLQYAVEALKVSHVIVCGHYSCGGVGAALEDVPYNYVDDWVEEIRRIRRGHTEELEALTDEVERSNRLSELNVENQVAKLAETSIVRDAWDRGQELAVHGLMFRLETGRLEDLEITRTD